MRKEVIIEIFPDNDSDFKMFITAGFGTKLYINHIDKIEIKDNRTGKPNAR